MGRYDINFLLLLLLLFLLPGIIKFLAAKFSSGMENIGRISCALSDMPTYLTNIFDKGINTISYCLYMIKNITKDDGKEEISFVFVIVTLCILDLKLQQTAMSAFSSHMI